MRVPDRYVVIEPVKPLHPVPPVKMRKMAEHHWLEVQDTEGMPNGMCVLQWCPGAERWAHSGNVGTGMYVNTENWLYIGHCPMPPI